VNREEILPEVIRRLPPIGKPTSSSIADRLYWIRRASAGRGRIRPYHLLFVDSEQLAKSLNFEEILDCFEDDAEMWIAEHARRRLFIHAGVVGWRGRAIILPGRSMSGKSTLVRRFLEIGATYFSDEYAVIDPHGLVHPYPRALSIRRDPGLRQKRIALKMSGAASLVKPLPIGVIAISNYVPEGKWRPHRITQGRAALAMLANTICARAQPEFALSMLPRIAAQAVVLKGTRGEADQMVQELIRGPYWN
jgi:hypothetical protein